MPNIQAVISFTIPQEEFLTEDLLYVENKIRNMADSFLRQFNQNISFWINRDNTVVLTDCLKQQERIKDNGS